MTQPTQQDVQQLTGAISTLATLLESWPPPSPIPAPAETQGRGTHSGGHATVSINTGSIGIAFAAGAFILAFIVVVMHGQRISDLRTDMQTERLSREASDNWAAQEVTAIRSYITNGKLQPMQPRPKRQPEKTP